jgi:cbb3-type cytochrome oxidase maturation protein
VAILFLLIPVSLVLVALGCWAFFWAVRSGQFDQLDSASWEILVEDEVPNRRDEAPKRRNAKGAPPCTVRSP